MLQVGFSYFRLLVIWIVLKSERGVVMTDPGILALLPDRPPQVTFSCDTSDDSCLFQFWVARVESFYCALDTCSHGVEHGYDSNRTKYECENIRCSCIPGRFICGEDGSVGELMISAQCQEWYLYLMGSWCRYWGVSGYED